MLLVISIDPDEPDDLPGILTSIDPPSIPHFAGDVRVAMPETVGPVLTYLDDDKGPISRVEGEVRAVISNAYYDARNAGRTMDQAATDAADRVVNLLARRADL
jgi:hypothetical protein